MPTKQATHSKAQMIEVLRRAGYPTEFIASLAAQLGDPIDPDHDGGALQRYGITLDRLIDNLGGSP